MGRSNKYDSNIKPHLKDIKKWIQDNTEYQICARLGVTPQSFEKYKKMYPELKEALQQGREDLVTSLKETLVKKALGYHYTETKTTIRDENGKKIKVIEKNEKYAHPDTGAIHLLLKNYDSEWRNDDQTTVDIKRKQLDLTQQKIEQNEW